ncbi:MAG: hypothetical protein ACFFCX_01265 [Candidatus Sifarchaeia archaeon]
MNIDASPLKDNEDQPKISWKIVIAIQTLVIITILVTVVFTFIGAFPFDTNLGIYRILPGNLLFDFVWLYFLSFLTGFIVYFASPTLSVFLWKLHRYLTSKNYNYYIQDHSIQEISTPQPRRMILPAFVALGISYSISNIRSLANSIFVSESFSEIASEAETIVTSLAVLFILLLLSCFIVLIFAPMWLMQDKGLVCEFKTRPRMTADIEGVGNWYLKMMKGFAGISTGVAYIFTIFQTVEWYQFMLSSPPEGGFTMLIFLIPVAAVIVSPLLALGPISVLYVLYEKSLSRNLERLGHRIDKDELDIVEIDLKKLV